MTREHRRLTHALLLSLLIHTLMLSLNFGGEGFGLPSFGFPWRERRIEATDLRLVIVPARVAAAEPAGTSVKEPSLQASIEHAVAGAPVPTPSVSPAPTLNRRAEAIVPKAKPTARAKPTAEARPEPGAATGTSPAGAPLHTEGSGDAAPTPIPEQAVLAVERSDEAALVVPPAPAGPTPVIAAEPGTASPESVMPAPRDAGDAAQERIDAAAQERADERAKLERSEREAEQQAMQLEAARIETARQEAEARQEAARLEAGRQEAERVENARLEAEREEARRQAAALQEAARQDAPRKEAQRVEDARLEAERQEAARQAARQEASRQEAERVEMARREAARREVERVEMARQEAERQEAARQATDLQEAARGVVARIDAARVDAAKVEPAKVEPTRVEVAQEAAARREAALRAIGRQLDEEADRRKAASGARRYWLFGRTDANAELILYVEAWSRKIQLNVTTFDMIREAAKQPHIDPLVTVAIRSDGSVESVTFVLSSGVAAIDETIRRIVDSQRPYQAFPPGLAREFDVILIRRSWHFDTAIRLQ